MKVKEITTVEEAIAVLIGSGVKINKKTKVQYWTIGMSVTAKMVKAGSVLDSKFDMNDKPEWKTKWVHADACCCRGCMLGETLKLSNIKNQFKKRKETSNQ